MAKKRKRRRPAATAAPRPATSSPGPARQDKKAAKREAEARARKAEARRGAYRRALIGGVAGLLVFAAISWFNRVPAPTDVAADAAALQASIRAGCDPIRTPEADPQRTHLDGGQAHDYGEHPATSGPHDPTPLSDEPRVYADVSTFRETQAVHSLEHGAVILYYRPTADVGGLPADVVTTLGPIANGSPATYLIPYPDLADGTALAVTAWNKILTCPAGITPQDAQAVVTGFVNAYACTSNAPEGGNGPGC